MFIEKNLFCPAKKTTETLSDAQRQQLLTLARRTWLFFEEFVGPDDNWLPPDHYQHAPVSKVGHYTSPTNMGLMLLSTLAAYDLGYIGILDLTTRLQFSFESIGRLERYQGHLLNWYNTQNLQPLLPRYVSTVDNGNFVCSLLILEQGCSDLQNMPLLRQERWYGVLDTLTVLSQIIEQIVQIHDAHDTELAQEARQHLDAMQAAVNLAHQSDWIEQLDRLTESHWQPFCDAIIKLISPL